MGACTGREQNKEQIQDNYISEKFNVDEIKNVEIYEHQLMFNSREDPVKNIQIELLTAKNKNDIQILIKYMENNSRLSQPINLGHPWAKTLDTIGSMASFYLALQFSNEPFEGEKLIDQQEEKIQQNYQTLISENVDKKIQNNLRSKVSKFCYFIISYNYKINQIFQRLTIDNKSHYFEDNQYIIELNKLNIFDDLLIFLDLKKNYDQGQRATVLFILKKLYQNNQNLIKKFLQSENALDCLKYLLQYDTYQHIQEGLTSLDDLCMDSLEKDQININNCNILVSYGFLEILKELKQKLFDEMNKQKSDVDLSFQEYLELTQKLTTFLIFRLSNLQQN